MVTGVARRRRLTPQEVLEIRHRYRDDETLTYRSLGEEYGMSPLAMNLLITGKTWAEVPDALPNNRQRGSRKGPLHHQSQLSVEQVREAWTLYEEDHSLTYADLADRYNVSRQVIANAFRHIGSWLPGEQRLPGVREARGRRRGERHPFALLTDEEVREMRNLRAEDSKKWTLTALSDRYEVCPSMVSRVLRGQSRREAGGPIFDNQRTGEMFAA